MGKHVLLQMMQCGVDRETALFLLPHINQCLAEFPAIACWQQLTQHVLQSSHPFPLHQLLYETTFAEWDFSQGPPPAWFPSTEQIQGTNIAALMRELNLSSYAALHQWSTRLPVELGEPHRDTFWDVMIRRLRIRFRQPYTQLLDRSHGAEQPQWLVNASFNIVESCFQAPEKAPAIVFQRAGGPIETWNYGELHALANRVANGLVQWGIQPGAAIAIDLPMTPEAVAIYLGIIQAGCVVVSIADSFAAAEIATRLRLAKAIAIFTQDSIQRGDKQIPLYNRVVEAKAPRAIVLSQHGMLESKRRTGDLTWSDFLSPNTIFEAVPASPASHTNILFSSGTTGDPKAIPWTQTTPLKCAVDAHLHHDIHPGDVVAWFTNLGWMMGPWLIYASLINQATIALFDGLPTTRAYGQFIQAARVTLLGVVPSLVSNWKATHCMQGLDWSAIKAFSSTGECSNPQDMLFLMSLAGYKPIIEYCGGTEIGGGYITGTLLQPCIPATFTTPALGLDFVILDADDRPANKGEGFLIPPSIGLSTELLNQDHHQVYFADTPHLDQTPLRRHGDYLERLPNGYYRVCGRVDDTMNLGGIKVSSADLEQVLNAVEGIVETAAIAVAPANGGPSQLIVYAVTAPHIHLTPAELTALLQAAIAQQLNPLFKIWDLVIVEALPRTASNKVMRRVLRDHYRTIAADVKTTKLVELTPCLQTPNSRGFSRLSSPKDGG
ncbi:AMP-binding protein [Stenomitos frigidus]|uniref:AMP-dependent synthetase n=1 Tax=Stenomitos frigidus ULC18 TaxID=2107698 RepID=A0A2T1EH28_9CYAN|nr:AMP-binding protein [Stenomitos frigidus]PSB32056.1 AMP-dependent synthetase [Stenomitos frigidus ULC18]